MSTKSRLCLNFLTRSELIKYLVNCGCTFYNIAVQLLFEPSDLGSLLGNGTPEIFQVVAIDRSGGLSRTVLPTELRQNGVGTSLVPLTPTASLVTLAPISPLAPLAING